MSLLKGKNSFSNAILIKKSTVTKKENPKNNVKKNTINTNTNNNTLVPTDINNNTIEFKNRLNYEAIDNDITYELCLVSVNNLLHNFTLLFSKIYFIDGNNCLITSSKLSTLPSNHKESSFYDIINYKINHIKNLKILIIYYSLFANKNNFIHNPIIIGFSLFNLTDSNNILIGNYKLPVYNPCYLKLSINDITTYYNKGLLNRYNISYTVIRNISTNNKENIINLKQISLLDYDKAKWEDNLLDIYNRQHEISNLEVMNLLKNSEFLYKGTNITPDFYNLYEAIDSYYKNNIKNSFIYDELFYHNIIFNDLKFKLTLEALTNADKLSKYTIEIYIINAFKKFEYKLLTKVEDITFNNDSDLECNNLIFDDITIKIDSFYSRNDFIIIRIIKNNELSLSKSIGYSLLPLFVSNDKQISGIFQLPIFVNPLDNKIINKIIKNGFFTVYKNIIKNIKKIKLQNNTIILSLYNNNFKTSINKADTADSIHYRLNNIFMPIINNDIINEFTKKC